jgi:hypothetical protein
MSLSPEEQERIRQVRTEIDREIAQREKQRAATIARERHEQAEAQREAARQASHAERQAMIAEMRRKRLEDNQAAWEKAEQRRNAARIRREAMLMWETKP